MITNLIATSMSSFGDKPLSIVITGVVAVFLFWFLWPSPEDDLPFAGQEEEEEDDDDDEGDPIDHLTLFDRIVPNFTGGHSPLTDVVQSDGDATVTFRTNKALRDVVHFIQAILDGADYDNRYSISLHLTPPMATFKIVHPVRCGLTLTQSTTENGMFVLAFEHE